MAGTCTGPGPCDTTSFGEGKNWVNKVGGLPDYIRAVAHAFRRKGLSESEAIQRAVGVVKNWAEGKGGVTPATRARAAAAVAEWEAKKARSHSLTAGPTATVDLAADPVFATTDGPTLTEPVGGHMYHHGWIRIDASSSTAVERATRAVSTDGHALLHGPRMVPAAQRVIERMKAAGHHPTVQRIDVKGTPHVHIARSTSLTAAPSVPVDLAWNEQLHPRGGKGTAAGGKFVAKNATPAPAKGSASGLPANMAANVRDFQRRAGLPVTGVIDTATAKKIHAEATTKGGGGSGKGKAKRAASAARKQISQHVTAVNALSPGQRAQYRAKIPTPPAGYVWSKNDTLRRAPNSGALRGVLATIGAKSVSKTPTAARRTTGVGSGGQRTATSLTRRRHH